MDTTAFSFSTRSNAKRAAEQMIAKGVAPAADYGIERRDNGRFEIVWRTALTSAAFAETLGAQVKQTCGDHMLEKDEGEVRPNTGPSTDEVEAEIVTAGTAANEAAAPSEPRLLAPALSEPAPIAAQPEPENKWPDATRVMVPRRHQDPARTLVLLKAGAARFGRRKPGNPLPWYAAPSNRRPPTGEKRESAPRGGAL
jgi:hypothetical protein